MTPATDERLDRCADHLVQQIAVCVTAIGSIGNCRWLALAKPAREIAREHAGKGNRRNDFFANKIFDIFVGRTAQRVPIVTVRLARQHDHAVQSAKMVVDKLHGAIDRLTSQRIQM